jgi:hypothetical protein
MKLVVEYQVGDSYTWTATETLPVIYESGEALAVEFERRVRALKDQNYPDNQFILGGQTFEAQDFWVDGEYYAPEIFTVDEWFYAHGHA